MNMPVSLRIARRELRGGLRNFRIFLACLILGIAAIAAVGSVRVGIEQGLSREGASILGGDAELGFTYRLARKAERRWMARHAQVVSEIVDFRSLAVVGQGSAAKRALTQVKAVDGAYPLYGQVRLSPDIGLSRALARQNGIPGAVLDPLLISRLGLRPGDVFRLGRQKFRLGAALVKEPDAGAAGFSLGPPTIVLKADLASSGLLGAGSLFKSKYRLKLPPEINLAALQHKAKKRFQKNGMRWRDRRKGAPGVAKFVDRMGSFLVLVGLAGLAVGGIGISSAVRSYLDEKTRVIATLKTLGAESGMIFRVYFLQISALSLLGIALGVALGAALPMVFAPLIAASLPLPADVSVHPAPLFEAGLYGGLTALLFTLWPIARTESIRPMALFRDSVSRRRSFPPPIYVLLSLGLLGALVWLATFYASVPRLALWTFAGIGAALVVLLLVALALRRLARWLAVRAALHGRTALRLALGAIGGPASEAVPVILSLGLGLSVLAAIGQIDSNLRNAIETRLPKVAPSFFFVDIQRDELPGFLRRTRNDPAVSRVEAAPMLRGIITRINGRPAREVAGNHWVVTGDRGVSFAARLPARTHLSAGKWWPADYAGPPLVSMSAHEAGEIGLKLGDTLTINILGRDITATIASFREVDFSTAGMGFVLVLDPAAVAGAPYTSIATVYARADAEAKLLGDLSDAYPNITAIRVRDAVARVVMVLGRLAAATSYGALATLLTGFVVLIGAAAAGERSREYEAAILKTLGATRGHILTSFALRAAILGTAAGLVAIAAGAGAGWAVMHFVMKTGYSFAPVSAFAIVAGGGLVTVLAGLLFAIRPLSARPARILRARE